MSRQLDVTRRHVYDSDHDEWVGPFDTENEATAYASELISPDRTDEVFIQAAPVIAAFNYGLVGAAGGPVPLEIAGFNPARIATRVKYVGTGVCLIGTKEGIAAGQGYALTSGSAERFEIACQLFVNSNVGATFAGTLYVFNEEIAAAS